MNAMDSHWVIPRIDKRIPVVARLMLVVLVLCAGTGIYLVTHLQQAWQEYTEQTSARDQALFRLQGLMGYGGLVHHFKDYVLRRDIQLYHAAQQNLAEARLALTDYGHFNLSNEEKVALSLLRQTLDAFEGNLELVRRAIIVGEAVPGVDLQVKMDSNGAKTALNLLHQHIETEREEQQSQINSLVSLIVLSLLVALLVTLVGGGYLRFCYRKQLIAQPVLKPSADKGSHLPALLPSQCCDLTGVANRRALFEQGGRMLKAAKAQDKPFSVLVIDVDNFRRINELLGPGVGDRILLDIAKRLKSYSAQEDLLARIGGDEFALLLHQRDALAAARKLAEMLHDLATADYQMLEQYGLMISCSVGGAMYPDDGTDLETLLKVADLRMYSVRRQYRAGLRDGI